MIHNLIFRNKNIIFIIALFFINMGLLFAQSTEKNSLNNQIQNSSDTSPMLITSSILPIYSIVSMAIDNIPGFKNELIILPNLDEHDAELTLKDISKLRKSDIIFITTSLLEKNIINDSKKHNYINKIIALGDNKNIIKHIISNDFANSIEQENIKSKHVHNHLNNDTEIDPHIWLSISNVKIMLEIVVKQLIKMSPKYKNELEQNKKKYMILLDQLKKNVAYELKDHNKKFISYHNAWKYYVSEFKIQYLGAITNEQHEHLHGSFSPRFVSSLIDNIKKQNITCIFNEEQFQDPILKIISRKTGIKILPLNPLGFNDTNINPADLYFNMILYNTKQFKNC